MSALALTHMRCLSQLRSLASQPGRVTPPRARSRVACSPTACAASSAAAEQPRNVARYRIKDAADTRHVCPCCGNDVRGRTARQHLGKCAPDVHAFILSCGAWPASPHDTFVAAVEGEAASLARLKQLRFREGLSWEEAATAMSVPVQRVRCRRV